MNPENEDCLCGFDDSVKYDISIKGNDYEFKRDEMCLVCAIWNVRQIEKDLKKIRAKIQIGKRIYDPESTPRKVMDIIAKRGFAQIKTVAGDLGMHRNYVGKLLSRMEDLGLVKHIYSRENASIKIFLIADIPEYINLITGDNDG